MPSPNDPKTEIHSILGINPGLRLSIHQSHLLPRHKLIGILFHIKHQMIPRVPQPRNASNLIWNGQAQPRSERQWPPVTLFKTPCVDTSKLSPGPSYTAVWAYLVLSHSSFRKLVRIKPRSLHPAEMSLIQLTVGLDKLVSILGEPMLHNCKATIMLRKNLERVTRLLNELKTRKNEVDERVRRDKDQFYKERAEVEIWINKVNEVITDFQTTVKEMGTHLSFSHRIKYGRKIKKFIGKLEALNEVQRNLTGTLVYRRAPPVIEEMCYEPSVGRDHTVEMLVTDLQSEKHCVIGLYGGRGIGKTTVLSEVHKRFAWVDHKVFDVIIWVDASSYKSDMSKIIDQIANRVLKDHENETPWKGLSVEEKRKRICAELSHTKFLLILDAVRCVIDFKKIGVPILCTENGSKALFACRSSTVCARMKPGNMLEIPTLSEDDAWKLFCHNAAINDMLADPEKRGYAEEVCRQCHGVPEQLAVIGSCMASATTVAEWKECWETESKKRFKSCWEELYGVPIDDE